MTNRNPLEVAYQNYHLMEQELTANRNKIQELLVTNMSLLSEVSMLREALERSDSDRIRLQAISSTLLGRLLAINDCIGGAVKASIRDGIEAAQQADADPELEQASREAGEIIQRVQPMEQPKVAPVATPLRGAHVAALAPIDWSRLPQGSA